MKKLLLICTFIAAFISTQAATFHTDSLYSRWMVNSRMGDFRNKTATNKFLTSTTSRSASWDYVPGLVAKSIIKVWEHYKDSAWADYMFTGIQDYADNVTPTSAVTTSLDAINAAKIYFELYRGAIERGEISKSATYRKYATSIRDTLKNSYPRITTSIGKGGFYHKSTYVKQMWLDGLYMGPAFYAEWQSNFGTSTDSLASWNDIALQFDTVFVHTWDNTKQLNYHAWAADPTTSGSDGAQNWANQKTGCSSEFWARGEGWFFAALIDVLDVMPKDLPAYSRLKGYAQKIAAGLAARQDAASGVWYQLLQYDNTKEATSCTQSNYLESSASSMFTYAYLKGIRLGLLDSATYIDVATKAYKGVIDTFVVVGSDGTLSLRQSCTSAGLGSSRIGDANYYLCGSDVTINNNTEGKVLGPFIMASLEYEMLNERSKLKNAVSSTFANPQKNALNNVYLAGTKLMNPDDLAISIYNIVGDRVLVGKKTEFSLENQEKGIYIVRANGTSKKIELR